ncbi:MAG: mandelate racemase/muconate lactonizing enzyme family protein [Aggregatilineales bacterium]
MKIRKIIIDEVIVPAKSGTINSPELDRPLHKLPIAGSPGWSKQFDEISKVILQVELDNGVIALGECYRGHDWPTLDAIAKSLIGQSLKAINRQSLPIGLYREYDGFECAIWDGYAKSHDLPLVDLLGGAVRERVLVSAWTGHRTISEMGDLAVRFAEQGFNCWKLKCDLEDDVVAWCATIAEAAPGMGVILDPNERWETVAKTKQRIDGLREIGNVLCLEDPIPRYMLNDYRDLRSYSSIPIFLHVSLPYILHGQRVHDAISALQNQAVDGFNFNGGLAKFQQLDHIAHAANLPSWHGSEVDLGILEAMYIHQSMAAQSCTYPSDIFGRMVRSHDLLKQPLKIEPPYAYLPDGAGLGVELDPDAISHYRIRQEIYS